MNATLPRGGGAATVRQIGRWVAQYGVLVGLALLVLVCWQLNPRFLTLLNVGTLLEQNAPMFIVAVGMTFAIAARAIDLTPASLIALCSVVTGLVFRATGDLGVAIAAGFATAIAVDVLNGVLIVRLGLNPLIVTLASWIWARGLAVSLTRGTSIPLRHPFYDWLVAPIAFEISPAVLMAAATFIIGSFVLNQTRLGRYTLAMGSDVDATVQAGVRVGRYTLYLFTMLGVLVGMASLIVIARLGAAVPTAAGGLELDAIVAVIIGGNAFQGGEARMRATLVGALFIAVLNNGLTNLGMLDAQIAMYKGGAIILVLLLSALARRVGREVPRR